MTPLADARPPQDPASPGASRCTSRSSPWSAWSSWAAPPPRTWCSSATPTRAARRPCTLETERRQAAEPRRGGQDGRLAALRLRRPAHPLPADQARASPPFDASVWSFQAGKLLEFSPIVAKGTLYFQDKDAALYALSADNGKVEWTQGDRRPRRRLAGLLARRDLRRHAAEAPGVDQGEALALRAKDGKLLWRFPLPGRSETSPIVYRQQRDRRQRVRRRLRARPQDRQGRLAGAHRRRGQGRARARRRRPLRRQLRRPGVRDQAPPTARTSGSRAPRGSASAAAGRSTRPRRSPTAASTWARSTPASTASTRTRGELLWSHSTGDWVYAAPAVADTPKTDPTVYVGSKDQNFYALDAKTGAVRWQKDTGGVILGAATCSARSSTSPCSARTSAPSASTSRPARRCSSPSSASTTR